MHSVQLSETPEVIGSGPAVNPRMVTWPRFAYIDRPTEMDHPWAIRSNWPDIW
jgi:hypothetical protein